jgi:hypothetical protein
MYVTLRRGESSQNFNVWVYGEEKLSRGSGLFVGQQGIVCNHHFVLPKDGTSFQFIAGQYTLHVYASVLGKENPVLLHVASLTLDRDQSADMSKKGAGVYFDWGPDSKRYSSHIEQAPSKHFRSNDLIDLFLRGPDAPPESSK